MAVVSNGTTIIDAGALGSGVASGKMTLLKTLTASSSSTLSFVDGADSVVFDDTYDTYVFKIFNIHPANNSIEFRFNGSADTGSNYNVTKTSNFFETAHYENDSTTNFRYRADLHNRQSTAFQCLASDVGNLADECTSGTLTIFNPSSTTFIKHFISSFNCYVANDQSQQSFIAGYFNTTSAVDAIRFQMSSGNMDSGVIKLYGIGG